MPETDIYKNREPIQQTSDDLRFRKGRRRRSSSLQTFDEQERKRRSKNSGLRRLLHLSRKKGNEKHFWWGVLIVVVLLLTGIGLWQFWYLEHVARKQARENELYVPIQRIPKAESAAE